MIVLSKYLFSRVLVRSKKDIGFDYVLKLLLRHLKFNKFNITSYKSFFREKKNYKSLYICSRTVENENSLFVIIMKIQDLLSSKKEISFLFPAKYIQVGEATSEIVPCISGRSCKRSKSYLRDTITLPTRSRWVISLAYQHTLLTGQCKCKLTFRSQGQD